jgi:adenosylcobinamide-GDP ribazoletransferase
MGDALRLALTTLTVAPVRGPAVVDRDTAGRAMLLAPVVGLALGAAAAGVLIVARAAVGGGATGRLLSALLAVGALVWMTRALHLDGLADTADGLGSGRPPEGALDVMRRSDIGPFGVVTLVLVLLAQVVALAGCVGHGRGTESLLLAGVASRTAVVLAVRRGTPAARPEGLGALVAGTAPRWAWLAWALAGAALAAAVGYVDEGAGLPGAARAVMALTGGLAAAGLLLRRCLRRLGGVTGDVLGALDETTATTVLVLLTFGGA